MITVGLRFARRDATLLHLLAARVRAGDFGQHDVATFHSAAVAAASGEPLIVHCTHLDEARLMAGGYTLYGVTAPVIESLSP